MSDLLRKFWQVCHNVRKLVFSLWSTYSTVLFIIKYQLCNWLIFCGSRKAILVISKNLQRSTYSILVFYWLSGRLNTRVDLSHHLTGICMIGITLWEEVWTLVIKGTQLMYRQLKKKKRILKKFMLRRMLLNLPPGINYSRKISALIIVMLGYRNPMKQFHLTRPTVSPT